MKKWLLTELASAVEKELEAMGFALKTRQTYHYWGTVPIMSHYESLGEQFYSAKTTDDFVAKAQSEAKAGIIPDAKRRRIRKTAAMLSEYALNECINWRALPSINVHRLSSAVYRNYLNKYEQKLIVDRCRATTLRGIKPLAKHFMRYLEDCEITDTREVTADDILSYLPVLSESYKRVGDALSVLRPFLKYLYSEDLLISDFTSLLQVSAAGHRKYYYGFTKDEAQAILQCIDKSTPCGKRDYAIILLAMWTGLRAIDVLGLQFGDIDWTAKKLCILQHKTQRPLTLPLDVSVCNAIADYILNGRPKSTSSHIFLRARVPYRKLESWSGCSIVKRAVKRAGIVWSADEWKGFHSFRRSLGNWMLESEIPLSTISEVLGHARVDSSKPYIMTHHIKLLMCTTTLQGIETTRRELL